MFQSTKTSQVLTFLTIIVSSITVMNSTVIGTAAAQEQQYSFVTKWGSEGIGFGKFRQLLDIAMDSDSDLYVTDTTSVSNQIQKFASNGTFIT
jgi:hypothetical protein